MIQPELPPAVAFALDRHAVRRSRGIPTISLFPEPLAQARDLWSAWAKRTGGAVLDLPAAEPDQAGARILAHVESRIDLSSKAFAWLQDRTNLSPTESDLSSWTLHDLEQVAGTCLIDSDDEETARLCLSLLRKRVLNEDTYDSAGFGAVRLLKSLSRLLAAHELPYLFLTVDAQNADVFLPPLSEWGRIAESVPRWPIAIALNPGALNGYGSKPGEARVKSMLEAGLIEIEPGTEIQPVALPEPVAAVSLPMDIAPLISSERMERVRAAYDIAERLRPRADEEARSAAERFLFELLESDALTKGHFVLNGRCDFKFGNRLAEIDLLAGPLRLAVEVDGYHHFTEPERFRRDRRKDWELQQRQYVVLRVLADDVMSRPREVLDFIRDGVAYCVRRHKGETSVRDSAH